MGVAGPYRSKAGRDSVNSAEISEGKGRQTVAKVIKFYVPNKFRKSVKWISPEQRGKIIEFTSQIKKSA